MPIVPGLRSAYAKVGPLYYFGRMLDKIRLHAAGQLPADYLPNLGIGFDGRACAFLRVDYTALRDRTLAGGPDEEILAWAWAHGGARTDDECYVWSRFMAKVGWRDERSAILRQRIVEYGFADRGLAIETMFDLFDYDEGRDPVAQQAWLT